MTLPKHIALIPDGNRRWAKGRGLPSYAGHQAGAEMAEKIFDTAYAMGLEYVTFWGASISNVTKRDPLEVKFLYELFERYFKKLLKSKVLQERQARVRMLGFWEKYFPKSLQNVMRELEEATKHFDKRHLTFLLAYNGTDEMLAAINTLAQESDHTAPIDAAKLKTALFTHDLPPVDLVIRTGLDNDPHNSAGFMMWDTAEAQWYFTDIPWPAFNPAELQKALDNYAARERRLGA